MLKAIAAVAALAFAGHAFAGASATAAPAPMTYRGGGTRKSPDGAQGKYTYTLTMMPTDTGFSFQDSLTVFDQNGAARPAETAAFSTKNVGNDFFDVLDADGTKTGHGYLFTIGADRFLHFFTDAATVHSEVTWAFMRDHIYELGSVSGTAKGQAFEFAYQGDLALAH